MSSLDERFEEDRKLRDTARAILLDDIAHARANFSPQGVADRTVGRVGEGAKDVYEIAKIHADDNRGIIAIVIGLLLLWLGREPIMEALGMIEEAVEEAAEAALEANADADTEEETGASPDAAPMTPVGDNDEH